MEKNTVLVDIPLYIQSYCAIQLVFRQESILKYVCIENNLISVFHLIKKAKNLNSFLYLGLLQ